MAWHGISPCHFLRGPEISPCPLPTREVNPKKSDPPSPLLLFWTLHAEICCLPHHPREARPRQPRTQRSKTVRYREDGDGRTGTRATSTSTGAQRGGRKVINTTLSDGRTAVVLVATRTTVSFAVSSPLPRPSAERDARHGDKIPTPKPPSLYSTGSSSLLPTSCSQPASGSERKQQHQCRSRYPEFQPSASTSTGRGAAAAEERSSPCPESGVRSSLPRPSPVLVRGRKRKEHPGVI